jgi:hypothetical protein
MKNKETIIISTNDNCEHGNCLLVGHFRDQIMAAKNATIIASCEPKF